MPDPNRPLLIPASTGTRVLFATICLLGSLGGVLAALAYELKLNLSLAAETRAAGPSYEWARSPGGRLIGARSGPGRATLEIWPAASGPLPSAARQLWSHETRGKPQWIVDPDGAWAAWIAGGELRVRSLAEAAPDETRMIEFSGKTAALAAPLPGDAISVIFTDGTAGLYSAATLELRGATKVPAAPADQWIGEGSWAGIWRSRASTVEIFEADSSGNWTPRGVSRLPAGSRPAISSHGAVTGTLGNRVWKDGAWHRAPGQVRSVAVRRFGGILATGDFDGVYLLNGEDRPEKLAPAAPYSLLSIAGGRLVVSGGAETVVHRIRGYELFTERGRLFVYGSAILSGVLLLYLVALFLRLGAKLWEGIFDGLRAGGARSFAKRNTPPPQRLVDAFRAGASVLWAGSGLSAQSGHPTWNQLLDKLEETAAAEAWFPPDVAASVRNARRQGDDAALEEIVHRMYERRARMVEFVCNIYGLPAQLSKAHYALYRLPFRACITTNYDNMLERLGPEWNARLFTPSSRGYETAVKEGKFSLLKLYGDLRDPDTIKLCPSELFAAAEAWGALGETLRAMFERNSFLFVGVSPERLLADLRGLGFPNGSETRHWVVTGVQDRGWARASNALRAEFGVEVIPFRSREVDIELPLWLDDLAKKAAPAAKPLASADPWYVESKAS